MAIRSRMRHRASTADRILRTSLGAAGLALLFAAPATALDPETSLSQYLVSFWQESAGLPQKFVNSLYQSRDGYLWVGTKGGLARFDGVSFEVYDDLKPDQLREAEVWAVAEGPDGSLWIGTYGGGLSRFFEGRFHTIARDEGLPSNMVLDLVPLADGRLWIATAGGLVLREADGRLRSFGVAEGLPSASILSLLMDSDETLWVGTEGGLASVRDGRITSHAAAQRQVLGRPVSAIVRGTDGGLWLALSVGGGQGYGLARYEGGQTTHFTTRDGLPSDSVTSLAFDSHGALWIGTLGGLSRYRSGRFESYSAQTTAVSRRGTMETVTLRNVEAVLADREGNLWVGTQADGLARLRDTQFVSVTPGLSADFNSVFEDREGGMWVGATEGIRHLLPGREVRYALPGDLSAQCFAQDPQGVVWIGTQRGVFVAEAGAVSRLALGEVDSLSISVLFTDARGRVWIGARQSGLFRHDGRALRRYGPEDGVLGTQVRTIAESPEGEIWVGTRNGGVTVIRNDGVRTIGPDQGLASETAQSIWLDRDGDAWVATRKGLCRIRNGRVTTITAKSGLPSNYFYQIIEDDERHLWLTFARGIVRVARSELNHVADGGSGHLEFAAFGTDNGMCSTAMTVAVQPTAWKRTNGELWFATARCVSVIHPRVLARRSAAPEAKVETLSVGARNEAARSGLRFAPGNGNVEIRYTGLSLVSSERMTFRYRMDTVHEGWIDAGTRRVAYFTGLGPGDHDFEVVACGGEGICSETGAKLSFHLEPRFTQTWWWRAILGLLAFAAVFAAYRWRVRALEAYQQELARRIDERTRDLQQEVEEHQRTEARLGEQMGERERAEAEAREYAHKLAASNVGLLESHEAIERENAERKRAEEEAGRERDLLHALMDNTPDQIYFKDASLRYTRVNEAHARALGLPGPSAAVGRTDADFFSEEYVKTTAADERLLLTRRTPLVNKVDHDPRSRRWFMATKAPLGDSRGEALGLVGISKDITQRRQAEEKLEQDLHELLHAVSRIAQGDLRVRARTGDDVIGRIAASVNEMQTAFAAILGEVHQVASAVVSTASRILTSANEIAQAAQYGSEEASSTTASVERMASAMTKVAGSAEQSATTAKRALEHVTAGAESVGATYVGMTRIDLAVSETATKMRLLEARSREIVEITELIEEIGSQSNLLSLNAAIEAAHAGEAGRGFSVVAEEIRRLAERSKAATSNVTGIVSGIVDETRTVLQAMENGMTEVRNGRELSERAQKSLKDIERLVGEAATLSGGIASASQQQTKATEAVAEAMQAIASITHESAAGATQATRAVQDLVALSEKLGRALSRFTIDGGPPS